MSELEGPSDGLVSVASAQAFGTILPSWPADHLRQMNWMTPVPGSICPAITDLYAQVLNNLAAMGFSHGEQFVALKVVRNIDSPPTALLNAPRSPPPDIAACKRIVGDMLTMAPDSAMICSPARATRKPG